MMKIISFFLLLFAQHSAGEAPPIVLVPGIGGSQIEAQLNREETTHLWCEKSSSGWFTLWLSVEELLPYAIECWTDNMKLVYDEGRGRMVNTPGVKVRVPQFGNTSSIDYLDPSISHPGEYFFPLVDFLVKNFGYKRGKSIRAAPYDFRYAPDSISSDYFIRLKALIEETSALNGGVKVLLFSHSMGGPYALHFLHQQTQDWKDKYIHLWVTAGAVWAGAVKALRGYASGDPFGVPTSIDKPILMRAAQRTYTSLAFITPSHHFWADDEIIIITPTRNYTVADYDQFFHDIGFPLASKIRKMITHAWSDKPPNVPMYCFYGTSLPTPGVLTYTVGQFPDIQPSVKPDDGDGTVNIRSLKGAFRWRGSQSQPIFEHALPGAEHLAMLGDTRLLATMKEILSNNVINVYKQTTVPDK